MAGTSPRETLASERLEDPLPFVWYRAPSFSDGMPEGTYGKVVAEVRRELGKDPTLIEELAQTLAQQMQRFRGAELSIETAIEGARKISGYFDLGEPFVASVLVHVQPNVRRVSTLHLGEKPGSVLEIVQSASRVEVRKPSESWKAWRSNAR